MAVAAVIRAFPFVQSCCSKAKFHYTGPTGPDRTHANPHGPARTLSETRTDPTEFLGDPAAKKSVRVRAGPVTPVGSGRARVVEFSYNLINLLSCGVAVDSIVCV